MIWREKRFLLIGLAVLLAANTIFFFTYRVQYENRLRALDARLDQTRGELQKATLARVAAEQQIAGYRKVQTDIHQVYDVEWSTRAQRLTAFIAEVMRLANASRLVPKTWSFAGAPSTKNAPKGQNTAPATEVSISFPISGTYQQVRNLINLLETSNQFIIIDQITLNSDNGDHLNVNLRVKTLFRDTAPAPRPSNQEL